MNTDFVEPPASFAELVTLLLLQHWPVLVAAAIGWLMATLIMAWRNNKNLQRSLSQTNLRQQLQAQQAQQQSDQAVQQQLQQIALLQGRLQTLQTEYDFQSDALQERQSALTQSQAALAATQARLESSGGLKQEFEQVAQQVLADQGQAQGARLNTLLQPFREQLGDFRQRVDEVYRTEGNQRASLLTEMKNLQQASDRVNEQAGNLASALKGDKKLQGNWGELVLERVLEHSGLRVDEDYLLQPARRNIQHELKRPDVIVRLPDEKDVIIDAKVSLNAYEQSLHAESALERTTALRAHVTHLRQHAKRLAAQDYSDLVGVRSLDFVLMFVPIESAFAAAMEEDPKLFTDAFNDRVVPVSPATLMLCLRIIHNLWRYENQDHNAQEIAARAGQLYDKLRGLVEDVDLLGKQLATVERTYAGVAAKLVRGQGNLVGQAERFRELGAAVKRPIDTSGLDQQPLPLDDAAAETGVEGS